MDHHQIAHAKLQQRTRRMTQRHRVQFTVIFPNLKPGSLAGFDLIEKTIVGVLQCRGDDGSKAVAVLAHGVDTRFEPGRLRRRQKLSRLCTIFFIRGIQRLHEQQITQVKKTGLSF